MDPVVGKGKLAVTSVVFAGLLFAAPQLALAEGADSTTSDCIATTQEDTAQATFAAPIAITSTATPVTVSETKTELASASQPETQAETDKQAATSSDEEAAKETAAPAQDQAATTVEEKAAAPAATDTVATATDAPAAESPAASQEEAAASASKDDKAATASAKRAPMKSVAHVGTQGTSYESLSDAVAASKDGDTVYVDSDISDFSSKIEISGKSITVDGQGHVLSRVKALDENGNYDEKNSYAGGIFLVDEGAGLLLKNITLDGGASKWVLNLDGRYVIADASDMMSTEPLIESKGALSLEGVTVQNVAGSDPSSAFEYKWSTAGAAYGVRSRGGSVAIDNSNFEHVWHKGHGGAAASVSGGVPISVKNSNFHDLACDWKTGQAVGWDGFGGPALFIGTDGNDDGMKPTISGCSFKKCWSNTYGGAIVTTRYAMDISDTTFEDIQAWHHGGALIFIGHGEQWIVAKDKDQCVGMVSNFSNVTFKNCWHNGGWHSGYDCGGGVTIAGIYAPIDFKNCVFDGCRATFGGAVSTSSAHQPASFKRNADGTITRGPVDLTFEGCTLKNNVGEFGGAIYATNANVVMKDCNVLDNSAWADTKSNNGQIGRGGAIFLNSGVGSATLTLENSTVKNNKAQTWGGGIYVGTANGSRNCSATMDASSFLYGNTAGTAGDDVYAANGSSVVLRNALDMGLNGARTQDNHVIDGWYVDTEGNRYVRNVSDSFMQLQFKVPSSPVCLKADAQTYFIMYHANADDAEGTMADQEIGLHDKDVQINKLTPNGFTRKNWRFLGWATDPEGAVSYADEQALDGNLSDKPGDKIDLYAVWNGIYTVHFDKNAEDATGEMDDLMLGIDEKGQLPKSAFARDGYRFAGWALQQDGTPAFEDGETVGNLAGDAGDEITLYAVWEKTPTSPATTDDDTDAGTDTTDDVPATDANTTPAVKATYRANAKASSEKTPDTGDESRAPIAFAGLLGSLLAAIGLRGRSHADE